MPPLKNIHRRDLGWVADDIIPYMYRRKKKHCEGFDVLPIGKINRLKSSFYCFRFFLCNKIRTQSIVCVFFMLLLLNSTTIAQHFLMLLC